MGRMDYVDWKEASDDCESGAEELDCKPDLSGLDDGPYLPGQAPRKKPPVKSPEETRRIRQEAWATRRAKYGDRGHR
jgi:hypothetical protein